MEYWAKSIKHHTNYLVAVELIKKTTLPQEIMQAFTKTGERGQ